MAHTFLSLTLDMHGEVCDKTNKAHPSLDVTGEVRVVIRMKGNTGERIAKAPHLTPLQHRVNAAHST